MKIESLRYSMAILILMNVLLLSQPQVYDSKEMRKFFIRARDKVFKIIEKTGRKKGLLKAAKANILQNRISDFTPFPCNVTNGRSRTPPSSVHQLRPGDIDVIGAIGDSLTAGNGIVARDILQIFNENRGLSAVVGGQGNWREFLTLPNILKEFNPKLVGYSLEDSLSHHSGSQFNIGEPLGMSQDTYYMAIELVKRIKNDKRVEFKKSWKLVTIFIGANDFCHRFCFVNSTQRQLFAENHRRDLMATLDYLRDNLPRTLVNVILLPNLTLLRSLKGLPLYCNLVRSVECPCLFSRPYRRTLQKNIESQNEWQEVEKEVANDNRYKTKSDFAVVLQPFTERLTFPEVRAGVTDKTYLSPDCFHLTQKSAARVANALWNNMLEPIGSKSKSWADPFTKFLCPTEERPFIFTHGNTFIW